MFWALGLPALLIMEEKAEVSFDSKHWRSILDFFDDADDMMLDVDRYLFIHFRLANG